MFLIYAIKSTVFVQFFLKLAQRSSIIINIKPIECEENPSNILGKGTISIFFSSCLRDEVHIFYPIILKLAQIVCIS